MSVREDKLVQQGPPGCVKDQDQEQDEGLTLGDNRGALSKYHQWFI